MPFAECVLILFRWHFGFRFAFIYFSKKEEAITALTMPGRVKMGGKCLTVTPRYAKDKQHKKNVTGKPFVCALDFCRPCKFLRFI